MKRARLVLLCLTGLLLPMAWLLAQTSSAPQTLKPFAQASHPPLNEMSGIVKSRRYPNTYWVHNDSGDEPRLFALRGDGTVIMPEWISGEYYIGEPVVGKEPYPGVRLDLAANFDWEDIALDGETIYVADLGNNGNARRDLGVYLLTEPNPDQTPRSRVLKWLPVAYPDQKAFPPEQWDYDCEAVFVDRGRLHLLTKHRTGPAHDHPGTGTKLYRLDTAHTDRVNMLTRLDSHPDLGGWVTGADLSPDGKTLAVLCQAPVQSVWLFEVPADGRRFFSRPARRLIFTGAQQCEAVCFEDDRTLLVTNEQRELFRLKVSEFVPAERIR